MECTCCGPCPQGGSLVRGSMSSCKSEFGICTILIHKSCTWEYSSCKSEFGVCTILILGTQMLPNLHQYSHDRTSRVLLNCCLYCFFSLGTAVKLVTKKNKQQTRKRKCVIFFHPGIHAGASTCEQDSSQFSFTHDCGSPM